MKLKMRIFFEILVNIVFKKTTALPRPKGIMVQIGDNET
jgi:hypothetical protein